MEMCPKPVLCLLMSVLLIQTQSARPDETGAARVSTLLKRHCVRCHGPRVQKADLRLDHLNFDITNGPDVDVWNEVRFRLLTNEMPPDGQPRPNPGIRLQVIQWLTQELRSAGATLREPEGSHLPKNGNRIDHEPLFSGEHKGPSSSPPRLWRLSPAIYESVMQGEIGKRSKGLAQPFSGLPDPGIQDFAAAFSIDEPTAAQLMRNASAIVVSQTQFEMKDGKFRPLNFPKKDIIQLFNPENQPTTDDALRKAIAAEFDLVLKRSPTESELARFLTLMRKNIDQAGLLLGVRTTLSAVLLLPEAVFRMEFGNGEADQHGRKLLAPRELAFAIAFALTDRHPDSELLRAAAENRLKTADDVRQQLDRIIDSPKIQTPRVHRFFREYFGYAAAIDVFKDKKLNPHHSPKILVSDTDRLIQFIVNRDQDVLAELLMTNLCFVNYSYDDKKKVAKPTQPKQLIHTSYGLPEDWKWTPHQPVKLSRDERAGILTQPSWLVAMSGNFDNHAILRGKWIRERLLGGTIPDLPITVDAQLPDEPESTLRHRMRVTHDDFCWNCHQKMNPLGLAFENFDHFGRFRTRELGEMVNASASIDLTRDSTLDGDYENSIEMLHQLANSNRVRQMFIRHAFRYWMGRNEELTDSPTLMAADREYVNTDGSFRALLTSLLTSDSFLLRTAVATGKTIAEP